MQAITEETIGRRHITAIVAILSIYLISLTLFSESSLLEPREEELHQEVQYNNQQHRILQGLDPKTVQLKSFTDMVDVRQPQSTCLISSNSKDGVGHQMEAKLSCIALSGIIPDLTYVHLPMDGAEHGANGAELEDFFGMQRVLPSLTPLAISYDEGSMEISLRDPKPYWKDNRDPCQSDSWFDENHRIPACQQQNLVHGKSIVFSGDQCWDRFYCELDQHPQQIQSLWMDKLAPILRSAIPNNGENQIRDGRFTVVAHVRRGDHGKNHSPGSYFRFILNNLVEATGKMGKQLDIIIHTNGSGEQVLQEIGVESTENVHVRAFGQHSKVTLQSSLLDMINGDIFLGSKSGLSVVAGLYRHQHPSTILYPQQLARMGLAGLGWSILLVNGDHAFHFHRLKRLWEMADTDFWAGLVQSASRHISDGSIKN